MLRNYFYLTAGLLCVLFAVTHTLNGMESVLQVLETANFDDNSKTTFTYLWHIIGIENLIFGVVLIIMAFPKDLTKVKFTAWLIMIIIFLRWIVITISTVLMNEVELKELLTESIAFFIIIALLYRGNKVKNKYSNG